MAKKAPGSDNHLNELKTIHQKLTASMADLSAGRITPDQLDEISRAADIEIQAIVKMRGDARE